MKTKTGFLSLGRGLYHLRILNLYASQNEQNSHRSQTASPLCPGVCETRAAPGSSGTRESGDDAGARGRWACGLDDREGLQECPVKDARGRPENGTGSNCREPPRASELSEGAKNRGQGGGHVKDPAPFARFLQP